MNNKGFAITGILYTIFILFSLILVSILAGISSRRRYLEKSVSSLENVYTASSLRNGDNPLSVSDDAPKTGKYKFSFEYSGMKFDCYSYLKKDSPLTLNSIDFTTKSCNDTYKPVMDNATDSVKIYYYGFQ